MSEEPWCDSITQPVMRDPQQLICVDALHIEGERADFVKHLPKKSMGTYLLEFEEKDCWMFQ